MLHLHNVLIYTYMHYNELVVIGDHTGKMNLFQLSSSHFACIINTFYCQPRKLTHIPNLRPECKRTCKRS